MEQQNVNVSSVGINQAMSDREKILSGVCPDCSNQLAMEEGCKKCYLCGFAACG